MDIVLAQSVSGYLEHLQRYTLALRSRNAMLREPRKYALSAVRAYDDLLVYHGSRIDVARLDAVDQFNRLLEDLSPVLLDSGMPSINLRFSLGLKGSVTFRDRSAEVVEDSLRQVLEESMERDQQEGRTRYGPHRDDFLFRLGDRALDKFGSEGECRLACLALRLCSLRFVRDRAEDKGVVLLVDDVLGELDKVRKARFFDVFDEADQVFVAATEMVPELKGRCSREYRVEAGELLKPQ